MFQRLVIIVDAVFPNVVHEARPNVVPALPFEWEAEPRLNSVLAFPEPVEQRFVLLLVTPVDAQPVST